MSDRGTYGKSLVGADVYYVERRSSLGTWLVGGLLVGGAVLWAKHQGDQIEKLYTATGLPHQSFGASLRDRSRQLSTSARETFHNLSRRLGTAKKGS